MIKLLSTAMLPAVLTLAGCASQPSLGDAQRLALYREHAGAPVDSFRYFGSFSGWTPLGRSALAVWTRPNEAFLLELGAPCPDLEFAHAISVSEQFHQVSARFDKVTPVGPGTTMPIPCHIREIRPLDTRAIKQAQQELREAKAAARAEEPAG